MKRYSTSLVVPLFILCAMVASGLFFYSLEKALTTQDCYTFHAVQNSHIRMNTCTGEAHMVFKDGKGGFEWVRVNE